MGEKKKKRERERERERERVGGEGEISIGITVHGVAKGDRRAKEKLERCKGKGRRLSV